MRLTVLVDNNASRDLHAEWGFSVFIEVEGRKVLFDLGASDLFLHNAACLSLDPLDIDDLVLSHGHWDHTWGLEYWLKHRLMSERKFENQPALVAHPQALAPKFRNDLSEFGVLTAVTTLERHFRMNLSREPVRLTENLFFLGEIERSFEFEKQPLGKVFDSEGSLVDDYLWDDSALVYKAGAGLVIISGCAHSGICNIVEYARKICNEERVLDIIGGFHLMEQKPDDGKTEETINYFKKINPAQLHPCHCNDLAAKIAMAKGFPVKEVQVGITLEYL
jgi:7,8-dihydropterin-6-yl-methyl-4-(beta-D-ribofuranosyl)aminobenzene 5'-phosphate synthase